MRENVCNKRYSHGREKLFSLSSSQIYVQLNLNRDDDDNELFAK